MRRRRESHNAIFGCAIAMPVGAAMWAALIGLGWLAAKGVGW